MNWDALSAISELIGVIAVVISLIYVAVQIRQNNTETKILRTQGLVSANTEVNALMASNSELGHITQAGFLDYNQLSADEQWRFGCLIFSVLNQYDFAYHQYITGQLEDVFWNKMEYELPLFIGLPGGRVWWEKDKSRFSPEFSSWLDRRLDEFEMPDELPTFGIQSKRNETERAK